MQASCSNDSSGECGKVAGWVRNQTTISIILRLGQGMESDKSQLHTLHCTLTVSHCWQKLGMPQLWACMCACLLGCAYKYVKYIHTNTCIYSHTHTYIYIHIYTYTHNKSNNSVLKETLQ